MYQAYVHTCILQFTLNAIFGTVHVHFWLMYMQAVLHVVCFRHYVGPSPLIKSQLLMINCQMS